MSSKKRTAAPAPASADVDVPVVGLREPCPCGSGRRYKACHGRELATAGEALVRRPFEGLSQEGDWVALKEIVPSATAPLTLATEYAAQLGERRVTLATVLPMAWPALVKALELKAGDRVQLEPLSRDPWRLRLTLLSAAWNG